MRLACVGQKPEWPKGLAPATKAVCAPTLAVWAHIVATLDSEPRRERPGHPRPQRYPTPKPDPAEYLRKGEGPLIKVKAPAAVAPPSPPRAGATTLRDNPPNSAFRRFYERGDLPISVDHKSFKNAIKWKARGRPLRAQ